MLMPNQTLPIRRPGMPLPPDSRRRCTSRLPYGKAQELVMRRALEADHGLVTKYSPEADRIYKVDLVVVDQQRPLLPAVGLQFTTAHNPEKMQSTIDMIRRTRIVERLLYLEAECRIEEAAFALIQTLVRHTAATKPSQGIVTAVLGRDEHGRFCLRHLRCFSIEPARAAVAA
jgi:hypothetical protein